MEEPGSCLPAGLPAWRWLRLQRLLAVPQQTCFNSCVCVFGGELPPGGEYFPIFFMASNKFNLIFPPNYMTNTLGAVRTEALFMAGPHSFFAGLVKFP